MSDSWTKQEQLCFLAGSNGSFGMNHTCSSTVLIRSFDAAFLTQNLETSFHFAMTKPVEVISVGRKLLQKFCNVIFIDPLCFMTLMSLIIM